MAKIKVKGTEISVITKHNKGYILFNGYAESQRQRFFVSDWLRKTPFAPAHRKELIHE